MKTTTKRIPFDRPTVSEIDNAVLDTFFDKERLLDGWERVYTGVAIVVIGTAPTKIRWGTGDETRPMWHEEEPNPVQDVYYHTEREYHCRQHNKGMIGIIGGTLTDEVIVNWHGYDKLIGER